MTEPASARPVDALAATYWDAFLETNPLFATTLGDPRFDGRLPDPTPDGQAAARARYAAILAQAERLDADDPAWRDGPGDAITLSSLREGLGADLTFIDSGLLAWNVDPLDGIPVQLLQAGEYQPASNPAQAAAMLERWRAMPAYTDAHAATLRRSLADGLVACTRPRGPGGGHPGRAARAPGRGLAARRAAGRPGTRRTAGPGPRRIASGSRRTARRRRRRDPACVRAPPRALASRDPAGRAPCGSARPVPPAGWRGDLPEPGPGAHLAGRDPG